MKRVRCSWHFGLALLWIAAAWAASSAASAALAQATRDVFRVLIVDDLSREDAEQSRRWMESWGYVPSVIEETGGRFRVLYGEFPNQAAAEEALARLRGDGITAQRVERTRQTVPTAAPTGPVRVPYTVIVGEYYRESDALQVAETLRTQHNLPDVEVSRVGMGFRVTVGRFPQDEAVIMLGNVRRLGYPWARLGQVTPMALPPPATPTVQVTTPSPQGTPPSQTTPVIDTALAQEFLKDLTPEQQERVMQIIEMMALERTNNPLVRRVVDLNARLETLDQSLREVVNRIDQEQTRREQTLRQIGQLFSDAENQAKGGNYLDAIRTYRQVIELDPDNLFGQRNFAERQINYLTNLTQGIHYPEEDRIKAAQYNTLKQQAEALARSDNVHDLQLAINLWANIKMLDPAQYGPNADGQISSLRARIENIQQTQQARTSLEFQRTMWILYGLGGCLIFVLILIILVYMRGKRRHAELMRKVQEITSIRPMRELEGGGAPLLAGAGGPSATDSDIFAPRLPGGEATAGDPLGGVAEAPATESPKARDKKAAKEAKKAKKEEKPAAAGVAPAPAGDDQLDALFGGGASEMTTQTSSSLDSMGLDELFGGASSSPPAEEKTAAAVGGSDADDIFSNLFATPEPPSPPAPEAAPAKSKEPKAAPATVEPPARSAAPEPAISFQDIVGAGAAPASPEPEADTGSSTADLLSVLEAEPLESVGASERSVPSGPDLGHLADSPFASLLGDTDTEQEGRTTVTPGISMDLDDTEIPPIRLDVGGASPSSGETTAASTDLPGLAAVGTAAPGASTNGGIFLDFEDEVVGQPPRGWKGQYPYASLTVENETPPKGSHQYLAFVKKEGAGKALYTYRFPDIDGVVGIEFDLRCNEKNKFLLGFYVEKDEDFQQSIHTKILRSESQTTPTIHMMGESAPYLLGSWAHIKYIVDLNEGKVNGYIDATHVARDLPLPQNPGSLNTLALRDNINTTGVLLLDNIRIYKIR